MSYEVLKNLSEHLQESENQSYSQGGRAILKLAETLLSKNLIPQDDGARLLIPEEEQLIPQYVEATDFGYDSLTGKIYHDGNFYSRLTPTERRIFYQLLQNSDSPTPMSKLMAGLRDQGRTTREGKDLVKTYISRLRSSLPVSSERAFEIIENVRDVGYQYNHFEKIPPELSLTTAHELDEGMQIPLL